MKSRGAPPPSGAAPAVSREIVNIVKKKLAAPSGAPPTTMKSITNRGTAYRGLDEDDEDDDNAHSGDNKVYTREKEEMEPRRNAGPKEFSHSSSEVDNVRTIDSRNNWETDDRSTSSYSNRQQGQFQQPRRAPYRNNDRGRINNKNNNDDDDDDDDGSYEYESSDTSGPGKGSRGTSEQNERRESDQRKRPPSISTNLNNAISEGKLVDRDRERGRGNQGGSKGTTPRKPATYNFQPLLKATYRELRSFVLSPCEPGITTKCYIERTRGGGNMFAPIYSLCADLEDGTGRELLVCRKVLQSMSSHYVFSLKTEDLYRKRDQRSRLFLGKLRSLSSSEYVLYDNGMVRSTTDRDQDSEIIEDEDEEDDKDGREDAKDEVSLFRKELAVICFNTKKRPAPSGIRGSEICIPARRNSNEINSSGGELNNFDRKAVAKDSLNGSAIGQKLQQPFEAIRKAGKQNQMHAKKCYIMHERTSRYDPLSSCLVDFKGRANMASVKNFQLVQSYCTDPDAKKSQEIDAEKDYILQVGKTTVECFNMDYRYPLSMLQAFAIAIARFDAKLSW